MEISTLSHQRVIGLFTSFAYCALCKEGIIKLQLYCIVFMIHYQLLGVPSRHIAIKCFGFLDVSSSHAVNACDGSMTSAGMQFIMLVLDIKPILWCVRGYWRNSYLYNKWKVWKTQACTTAMSHRHVGTILTWTSILWQKSLQKAVPYTLLILDISNSKTMQKSFCTGNLSFVQLKVWAANVIDSVENFMLNSYMLLLLNCLLFIILSTIRGRLSLLELTIYATNRASWRFDWLSTSEVIHISQYVICIMLLQSFTFLHLLTISKSLIHWVFYVLA